MNEIEKAIQILKVRSQYVADINFDAKKAYDLAITALEAQQAEAWIPVSSGNLPNIEYIRDIWVTARRKGYKERVVMRLNWNYRRFQHTNGKEISELWEILAWKPLEYPTPYKEEQA